MQNSEYKRIEEIENFHFWYKAMEESVLQMIKTKFLPGKKLQILDAGCGTGGFSEKLSQFGRVWAIDINPLAVKYSKEKNIMQVNQGSIEKLPFRFNKFDIITCLDVLYHRQIKDDLKALKELHRVLKPGGILILRLPAFEFLRGAHDVIVETRHRYQAAEVKLKLLGAGFIVEKITYANMILCLPLFLKRSLERLLHTKAKSDISPLPVILNGLFYIILSFENRLLKYVNLPFGSSVVAVGRKISRDISA